MAMVFLYKYRVYRLPKSLLLHKVTILASWNSDYTSYNSRASTVNAYRGFKIDLSREDETLRRVGNDTVCPRSFHPIICSAMGWHHIRLERRESDRSTRNFQSLDPRLHSNSISETRLCDDSTSSLETAYSGLCHMVCPMPRQFPLHCHVLRKLDALDITA
jgi:hypothetical protein